MSVNILELWEKEQAYRKTEVHHELCRICEAESDRIAALATTLYPLLAEVIRRSSENTVREEFSANSRFLHRGFYCPSPARDLITGTLQRGRLLKHPGPNTDITNSYGFDCNDRLLRCNYYNGKHIYMTEYLIYRENIIYGFTVNPENHTERFSEEIYENGRLVRYSYIYFGLPDMTPACCSLYCEELTYDTDGLASCLWRTMHRTEEKSVCHEDQCKFQRKDGFITHYTNRAGNLCKVSPPRQV